MGLWTLPGPPNPAPRVTCGESFDGQYFRDWPLR